LVCEERVHKFRRTIGLIFGEAKGLDFRNRVTLLQKGLALSNTSLLLEKDSIPSVLAGIHLRVAPVDIDDNVLVPENTHGELKSFPPGGSIRPLSSIHLLQKNSISLLLASARKRSAGSTSNLVKIRKRSAGGSCHQFNELIQRLQELISVSRRELTDLINVIKKPDPARTRNQIRLCILRGPGVIITPVDDCICVSGLSGSSTTLSDPRKLGGYHLSQNELDDGVLRIIALLMDRHPISPLGSEMEAWNLSVRVADEHVLIADQINYSAEEV